MTKAAKTTEAHNQNRLDEMLPSNYENGFYLVKIW